VSEVTTIRSSAVAVVGAGPIGLAAACHLLARGEQPLVLEAGGGPGYAVRQWSHVGMFSPLGIEHGQGGSQAADGARLAASAGRCVPDRPRPCRAIFRTARKVAGVRSAYALSDARDGSLAQGLR
jgi:2-polyprenyl-6-methoxyphenol hydroxylase-like FAD-dependent oxidoreductase